MKRSKRLMKLIECVPAGKVVADVGTDHGFVPIFLVQEGITLRAIASDVREGPLLLSREHVEAAGLSDKIDLRLGSGLSVLSPGEAEVILIAGMGGRLIADLLEEGLEVALSVKALILSPHRDAVLVRMFLMAHGFEIVREDLVEEEGKFYPVLTAVPAPTPVLYTETELQYGPVLLRERPEVFLRFLQAEIEKKRELVSRLRDAKPGKRTSERLQIEENALQTLQALLDPA